MSQRLAISLLLSLGAACGPPDFSSLDIVIDLDPPGFVSPDDVSAYVPLCDDDAVYKGDVGPNALPGEHLAGKCGIEGNVMINLAVEQLGSYFASIREVRGDVMILFEGSGGVMTALEQVSGELVIAGTTRRANQTEPTPMGKVRYAGSVVFKATSGGSTNALVGLTEVNGDLLIQGPQIANVTGLKNLERVGGTLQFQNVASIGAIDFPNLVSAGKFIVLTSNALQIIALDRVATLKNLSIVGNPKLAQVRAVALKEITGESVIEKNPMLEYFNAPSLENSGDLTHCDNGAGFVRDITAVAGQIKKGSIGPCRR